jgi:hypothetical protein
MTNTVTPKKYRLNLIGFEKYHYFNNILHSSYNYHFYSFTKDLNLNI